MSDNNFDINTNTWLFDEITKYGRYNFLEFLLQYFPNLNINYEDNKLLYESCRYGCYEIVKLLIEKYVQNPDYHKLLKIALHQNNSDIARYIINNNDIIIDEELYNSLCMNTKFEISESCFEKYDLDELKIFRLSCINNSEKIVDLILNKYIFSDEIIIENLNLAIDNEAFRVIKFLIKKYAINFVVNRNY